VITVCLLRIVTSSGLYVYCRSHQLKITDKRRKAVSESKFTNSNTLFYNDNYLFSKVFFSFLPVFIRVNKDSQCVRRRASSDYNSILGFRLTKFFPVILHLLQTCGNSQCENFYCPLISVFTLPKLDLQ